MPYKLSILHILSDSHLINEQNIILFIENRKKLPLLTDTFRLFYKYGLLNSNDSNQLYSILIQYSNEYYVACAVYGLRFLYLITYLTLRKFF